MPPVFYVLLCICITLSVYLVLDAGPKVMLPEGFELWVRLPLRDGERIEPPLLAVIVLDVREVVALHPDLAQVPAGLFYEFPRLAF